MKFEQRIRKKNNINRAPEAMWFARQAHNCSFQITIPLRLHSFCHSRDIPFTNLMYSSPYSHIVHAAPVHKVYHTPVVPAVHLVKTAPIVHGTYLHINNLQYFLFPNNQFDSELRPSHQYEIKMFWIWFNFTFSHPHSPSCARRPPSSCSCRPTSCCSCTSSPCTPLKWEHLGINSTTSKMLWKKNQFALNYFRNFYLLSRSCYQFCLFRNNKNKMDFKK